MTLTFLPHESIKPVFERMKEEETTEPLQQLVSYVETTWGCNTTWQPSSWSVYAASATLHGNKVAGACICSQCNTTWQPSSWSVYIQPVQHYMATK